MWEGIPIDLSHDNQSRKIIIFYLIVRQAGLLSCIKFSFLYIYIAYCTVQSDIINVISNIK